MARKNQEKSGVQGSNLRPGVWKTPALPTELTPHRSDIVSSVLRLARPALIAENWERPSFFAFSSSLFQLAPGDAWTNGTARTRMPKRAGTLEYLKDAKRLAAFALTW
jgi:hypothetical protein